MPTNSLIFLVFTGILAFAVLLQTLILLGFLVAAKAAQRKAMTQFEELQSKLDPLLHSTRELLAFVEEMRPRIVSITGNVQTASEKLRDQVNHIDSMVGEVTSTTRKQVSRIDTMIGETLDAIAYGTRVVQDNVMAPLRQIGGWMSTIRTAMDMMMGGGDRRAERRPRHSSRDY